ncbi:MAG: Ankyrin, partial [Paenibacillus sp.]|nr:Ankyrin [Paenibacillus sp.]
MMNERNRDSEQPLSEAEQAAIARFKEAVQQGSPSAVAECLDKNSFIGRWIDEPWFSFESPAIVFAAGRGNRELADTLLDHGADPNAKSGWWAGGFGTLHHDHRELALHLISRGAKPDMHAAAALGLLDTMAALAEEDEHAVNRRGPDGQVPLHFANSRETIDFLLDRGADIDVRDMDHGSTPAQYAVDVPWKCAYLLERGARPDLFMACMIGDVKLAGRLIAADPDCLRSEVGSGEFTSGESDGGHIYLYKIGQRARPLFTAEKAGQREVTELLLSHSSPAERLMLACWRADEQAIEALLSAHPGLAESVQPEEASLIAVAAWEDRNEAVRFMLQAGIAADARLSEPSMTALHRAAMRGNAGLVRLLLAHGASVETKHEYGGTALGACIWGSLHIRNPAGDYPETVRLLIAAGSRVPDRADGSAAVADALRRHGAK